MSAPATASHAGPRGRALGLDLALTAILVYGLLLGVGVAAGGLGLLDEATRDGLRAALSSPWLAVSMGMLATVIFQSSSVTVALAVAVAAATELPAAAVAPLILGANVGGTMASALVDLGAARSSREFERGFACAGLHDLYNLAALVVLLPLELATGALSGVVRMLADALAAPGSATAPTGWAAGGVAVVSDALGSLGAEGDLRALLMLVLGGGLAHQVLLAVSRIMQRVLAQRTAAALDRAVAGDRGGALGYGLVASLAVPSGVMTTSLLGPLVSAGVLPLAGAFPAMVGANVSTTVSALLAAGAVAGPYALAAALTHVVFNVFAAGLFHGVPPLRARLLSAAHGLGGLAGRRRGVVLTGALVLFLVLPVVGMLVAH